MSNPSLDWTAGRRSILRGITPKIVVLCLLLGLGVVPPLIFLFYSSIHHANPDGSFGSLTISHYADVISNRNFLQGLLNSAIYSLGAALLALILGTAQAWLAERTDAPLRQYLYVSAIVSLGIPYVLYIVAWLLFLGKAGPVNQILTALLGGSGTHLNVYSLGGMIFVEGLMWSPLAFLLLCSVFRNADAAHEEAATMCGAGLPSTLIHVTFGMARPALLALALLVFIKASEAFEVPALVGMPGSVAMLTSTIYQKTNLDIPPNIGSASAFGFLLLVMMAVLLKLYSRVSDQAHRYRTVTGKGFRPRLVRLGRWRYPIAIMIALIPLITVVIPLANIVWAALLPYYRPFSIAALPQVGAGNFIQAIHSQSFQESFINSLLLGIGAATAVTVVSAVAGWCVARRIRGAQLIDNLATMPLVFPAIVLGLAFLEIFVHAGSFLYGSLLSLVLASTIAYLPYGLRYAQLGVMQIHPELEEAASITGAGYTTTLLRIVLPLLVPALISCWLFTFLLAVRAMSMVLLLAGPDSMVVSVALFDMWVNGQVGELAALGCVWTTLLTVFSIAFYAMVRRYQLPIA